MPCLHFNLVFVFKYQLILKESFEQNCFLVKYYDSFLAKATKMFYEFKFNFDFC